MSKINDSSFKVEEQSREYLARRASFNKRFGLPDSPQPTSQPTSIQGGRDGLEARLGKPLGKPQPTGALPEKIARQDPERISRQDARIAALEQWFSENPLQASGTGSSSGVDLKSAEANIEFDLCSVHRALAAMTPERLIKLEAPPDWDWGGVDDVGD